MLFHELNLSREDILQSVADSLQSNDACIYVDTSVLLHCYEMRARARQELLNAFAHFAPRLWIPLWAARETWDHSHKDLSNRPLQQPVTKLLQEVKRFVQETRRYVDDETITQPAPLSRAEYETKLEETQRNMAQVANMVANYQRRADDTSAALYRISEIMTL
jgi:PIN like domain